MRRSGSSISPFVGDTSSGGGGEANTSSNAGTGEGLAKTKVGVDLPFKTLKAGTNIALSSSADEVTITASGGSANTTVVTNWNELRQASLDKKPLIFIANPITNTIATLDFDADTFIYGHKITIDNGTGTPFVAMRGANNHIIQFHCPLKFTSAGGTSNQINIGYQGSAGWSATFNFNRFDLFNPNMIVKIASSTLNTTDATYQNFTANSGSIVDDSDTNSSWNEKHIWDSDSSSSPSNLTDAIVNYYNHDVNLGSGSAPSYGSNKNYLYKSPEGKSGTGLPLVSNSSYRNGTVQPIRIPLNTSVDLIKLSFFGIGARTFGDSVLANPFIQFDLYELTNGSSSTPTLINTYQIPVNALAVSQVKANANTGDFCYGELTLPIPTTLTDDRVYGFCLKEPEAWNVNNQRVSNIDYLILTAFYQGQVI